MTGSLTPSSRSITPTTIHHHDQDSIHQDPILSTSIPAKKEVEVLDDDDERTAHSPQPSLKEKGEEEEGGETGPPISEDSLLTFPEGGRGWYTVLGGFLCTFISFGYANSAGIFVEYYQKDLLKGTSSSNLAWIASFQYFLLFFCGSLTGRIFDTGYYRPLFAAGIFLFLFGQCMLSLSTEYYQVFLTQGIILGLSYGAIFQVGVTVPQQWFHRRRASAMGIVAAGSSSGGIVFPVAIKNLIPVIGFAWTMRVIALIAAVCLSVAFLCLKTRLPPSIDVHGPRGWRAVKWFDLKVFKEVDYAFYVLGAGLAMLGLYSPFSFCDIWTSSHNIPGDGYWLAVLNAASMFGRVIPGFLADRVGRTNTLLPHLLAAGILMFIFPLTNNLTGMIFFSILYGFASGSYVSLIPAALGQLGPTSTIGTRLGMAFAGSSLGGLLGTPIAGAILGPDNSNWWGMSVFSGLMVCAGAGCVLVSRTITVRRTGSQKI
ncbi:hypothetical protein A4X13_0g8315 [Tilletia indica]|uniref:Major facilitator superfamily (MFS) profile domain-containing protein n=1 Tax=Tilletia indica TaxID=43049 RepID=A0A177TGN3_9BASI|nr:hypothetical protein A4X13_0g8315 [Tilletia indica]